MLIFRDEMDGKFVSENQRITLSTSSTDNFRSTHIQISRIYGQTGQRLKRGARVTDWVFAWETSSPIFARSPDSSHLPHGKWRNALFISIANRCFSHFNPSLWRDVCLGCLWLHAVSVRVATFRKIWEFKICETTRNKRATNGFLSQLLKSWLEDGAAHDAEIIFFARHIYQTEDMKYPEDVGQNFPPEWRHLIQVTKKRRYYVKMSVYLAIWRFPVLHWFLPNNLCAGPIYIGRYRANGAAMSRCYNKVGKDNSNLLWRW